MFCAFARQIGICECNEGYADDNRVGCRLLGENTLQPPLLTSTLTTSSATNSGFPLGAIVGIAIGGLVIVACVVVLIVLLTRRKRQPSATSAHDATSNPKSQYGKISVRQSEYASFHNDVLPVVDAPAGANYVDGQLALQTNEKSNYVRAFPESTAPNYSTAFPLDK
jgi:hypothetical protein